MTRRIDPADFNVLSGCFRSIAFSHILQVGRFLGSAMTFRSCSDDERLSTQNRIRVHPGFVASCFRPHSN